MFAPNARELSRENASVSLYTLPITDGRESGSAEERKREASSRGSVSGYLDPRYTGARFAGEGGERREARTMRLARFRMQMWMDRLSRRIALLRLALCSEIALRLNHTSISWVL